MKLYELEHWVLFDTMSPRQIDRLKKVIDAKDDGVAVDKVLEPKKKPTDTSLHPSDKSMPGVGDFSGILSGEIDRFSKK